MMPMPKIHLYMENLFAECGDVDQLSYLWGKFGGKKVGAADGAAAPTAAFAKA